MFAATPIRQQQQQGPGYMTHYPVYPTIVDEKQALHVPPYQQPGPGPGITVSNYHGQNSPKQQESRPPSYHEPTIPSIVYSSEKIPIFYSSEKIPCMNSQQNTPYTLPTQNSYFGSVSQPNLLSQPHPYPQPQPQPQSQPHLQPQPQSQSQPLPCSYPNEKVHYELVSQPSQQGIPVNTPEKSPSISPLPSPAVPVDTEKTHYTLVTQQAPQGLAPTPPENSPFVSPLPPQVAPPGTHYSPVTQPSISQTGISDPSSQHLIPPPSYLSPGTAPIIPSDATSSVQPVVEQIYENQTLVPQSTTCLPSTPKLKDDKKTGSTVRFIGDTLVGRFARSCLHTTTGTMRLVGYLSPWGDNNSLTLPNVRYRDAALFGVFTAVGTPLIESTGDLVSSAVSDTFAALVVDPITNFFVHDPVAKFVLTQVIEQAIDRGILDNLFPEREKMLKTTSMKTIQAAVKHKLMDVDADIRLFRPSESVNPASSEKGWFCPYLYASNRTPKIVRQTDFGIAQFFGPFLRGDHNLAEKLLMECASVMGLCDPDPTHDIGSRRLLVTVVGISPFRAGMWSSSRRPMASLIHYHLLDGCPVLVIPVKEFCPINAWSPITLHTMTKDQYNADSHHQMLCEFINEVVNKEALSQKMTSRFNEVLSQCVSMIINGAKTLKGPEVPSKVKKNLNYEKAGIAFFRY